MFGRKISGKSLKIIVWLSTAVYAAFVLLYFLPVGIPYCMVLPTAFLAVLSIWSVPFPISMALIASASGDLLGTAGNFMGQMECFAVAQLFIILFFVRRIFRTGKASSKSFSAIMTGKRVAYVTVTGICVGAILIMAMCSIVPEVPSGTVRAGVAFYSVIAAFMFFAALMQRSIFYALGAFLFVLSDFVLAWNLFVGPVPYPAYLIMVPYYMAQWMFFVRASKYRVGKSILLARL